MKNFVSSLFRFTAAGAIVAFGAPAAYAITLTAVPMQGGMVMPVVAYHAEHNHIHVTMPPEVPQLTPLLVSHPLDWFDPADPWFEALDPSRQGRSFSRRYGFVMDANSDPLPSGTQMWIRKVSGPAELKFYRYGHSVPKVFEPIFGTDGATNTLYWNGMMFHPAVTAPPGTNSYTAGFEVFLMNLATGQPVPDSGSGVLTFQFTNVPDGRPTLRMTTDCCIAWPSDVATNWVLEATSTPHAEWSSVTNIPTAEGTELLVTPDREKAQQFFRMRYVR